MSKRKNCLGPCYVFGPFRFYWKISQIHRGASRIPRVSSTALHLIRILIENRPLPVTREAIIQQIWGDMGPSNDSYFHVVVNHARGVLGDTRSRAGKRKRKYIDFSGGGYCFIKPVAEEDDTPTWERVYLEAQQALENPTDNSIRAAIQLFKKAVDLNPSHAPAWAALADAYIISGIHCVDEPLEAYSRAREAAEKAAEIDPALSDAFALQGVVKLCYDRDWVESEKLLMKGFRPEAKLPYAHKGMALLQLATGRAADGIRSLEQAQERNRLNAPIAAILCHMLTISGDYERAVLVGRKAVRADRTCCMARSCLGSALLCQSDYEEAIKEFNEAVQRSERTRIFLGFWAYACGIAGRRDQAEAVLQEFLRTPDHEYLPSYLIALVHLGLGNYGTAIQWLNKSCDERSHWVIFLHVDPMFKPLRTYPSFNQLIDRVREGKPS